jgi:diaphanous 1
VSTLDFVGPGSRSDGSKRSTHTCGDTAIQWAIRLDSTEGGRLEMDQRVMDIFKDIAPVTVHVSIDEEWLLETTPGHSTPKLPIIANTKEDEDRDEEDKEDTLKAQAHAQVQAQTPRKRTAVLVGKDIPTSPQSPGQARLSGLFHAWVDTNQHPAPPPTLAGGRAGTALLAEQLRRGDSGVHGIDFSPDRVSGDHLVRAAISWVVLGLIKQEPSMDESTPTSKSGRRYSLLQSITGLPKSPSSPRTPTAKPFISLSTASGSSFTKLLAQQTGDSPSSQAQDTWSSRLGAWVGGSSPTPTKYSPSPEVKQEGSIRSIDQVSLNGSLKPLEKQVTGGLWGWWTGVNKPEEGSAEAYIDGLRAE